MNPARKTKKGLLMNNNIENNMAQLMDGPVSSHPSKAPNPTFPPVVEKVLAIIERFISKYGSVLLEVFRLPTFSTAELQRYLNSLSITLKRHGIIAAYSWQYQPAESAYYLYLFHIGSIPGSISGIVHRLWHSSPSISQLDNIRVNSLNYADIKDRLLRSLLSLGATFLASPSPYYRHSYGASYSV